MTERGLAEQLQPASEWNLFRSRGDKDKDILSHANDIRLRMYPLEAFITSHQDKLQLPAEGFSFPEAGRV